MIVLRGFPGYQCPYCQKQVHDFVEHASEFAQKKAQVLLVYPGPSADLNQHATEALAKQPALPTNVHLVVDPDFLGTFRADSKFSTWLISIALNEARLRLRRSKTVALESLDENAEDRKGISPQVLIDWREIPSAVVEQLETRRLLQQAVIDLPLIYREVFILRDVEELSINEASKALGISISVVRVRLHRARIMLQKQLAPQFKHLTPKRRWLPW